MSQPQRDMRHKHLLQDPRLLSPISNDRLHNSHILHRLNRHLSLLHRQRLHLQRRNNKMHRECLALLLRMAVHLRQNGLYPTRLRSQCLHQHRIPQPGHDAVEQHPRKRNSLCHERTDEHAYVPTTFFVFFQHFKTQSGRHSRRHNRRLSLPLLHRARVFPRLAQTQGRSEK
jgi:hypothetical protein